MMNMYQLRKIDHLSRFALASTFMFLLAGCHQEKNEALSPPLPVKTFLLTDSNTSEATAYPITVVRDRESNLSFRVSGIIQNLSLRAGDLVKEGQVLATLQATPYEANTTRAKSELNKLINAEKRNKELLQAGAISTGAKEDTDDNLAASKAALSSALYDEKSTTIHAPFTGILLSRDAEIGETVSAGQRIFRISDLSSSLIAKASVPSSFISTLRIGALTKIQIDNTFYKAKVRTIGSMSDLRTGSVNVDLVFQDAANLPTGTVGSVIFQGSTQKTSSSELLIPPEALLEAKNGIGSVFVMDTSKSEAKKMGVKVLGFEGEMIRIVGLAKGDKVLTTGAGFVTEGQKILEIQK